MVRRKREMIIWKDKNNKEAKVNKWKTHNNS